MPQYKSVGGVLIQLPLDKDGKPIDRPADFMKKLVIPPKVRTAPIKASEKPVETIKPKKQAKPSKQEKLVKTPKKRVYGKSGKRTD